jgi:hypothetical protein
MVEGPAGLLWERCVTEMSREHMPRNTVLAYTVIFIRQSKKRNIPDLSLSKRLILNS